MELEDAQGESEEKTEYRYRIDMIDRVEGPVAQHSSLLTERFWLPRAIRKRRKLPAKWTMLMPKKNEEESAGMVG